MVKNMKQTTPTISLTELLTSIIGSPRHHTMYKNGRKMHRKTWDLWHNVELLQYIFNLQKTYKFWISIDTLIITDITKLDHYKNQCIQNFTISFYI